MSSKQVGSKADTYNLARYSFINYYFVKRLEGVKADLTSFEAAKLFWKDNNNAYRAKPIIIWAKEFLSEFKLSDNSQGIRAKRTSFLNDSDVKMMILEEIRKTRPAERSLVVIKKFVNEVVVPSVLGVPKRTVCETTLIKYLHEWEYLYRKNKKAIYFDGHRREDVVTDRDKWTKRMMEYMESMELYTGENEENILEIEGWEEGDKKYVFVTHDESTIYANDGKKDLRLLEGENYIRKKGTGSSIIAGEFQCLCYGTMKIRGWTSQTLFKAGDNRTC